MKRHSLLRYGTLASAMLPVVPTLAKDKKGNVAVDKREQPNVIILYADDLGYGDLECFGATRVQTPNVNALAKSGIRFTNVHAIAATSTPSRYGLLTGEYAFRHQGTDIARGNAGMIIRPEQFTIADAFKNAGAVATINATYEKESVYIRVDGTTSHKIDMDIVPYAGSVPQWKTDSSISTDGRKVTISYTGKGLSLDEQREAFEAIPDPNVFTSAPMLIEDSVPVGKYFATSSLTPAQIEKLSYEDPLRHQSVRHPRSAAALTADNHLILIVVDGRRPGLAEGMNAFELTSFIEEHFHPVNAINLDGGGSTALCVKGEGHPETHVVNYPSASRTFLHDKERRIPTHIHILDLGVNR